MVTILDRIDPFWSNWKKELMNKSDKFITPDDSLVRKELMNLDVSKLDSDLDKAIAAWIHVEGKVKYQLSRKWKTPRETLTSQVGDCEDMTFLLASMFSAMHIMEHKIALGNLHFPRGRDEEHSWNEVNGTIIDGTGTPRSIEKLKYEKIKEIKVITKVIK